MGEAVAVELIGDEQAEDGEARRIGPDLLLQQPGDEHAFDEAVAEQVECIEVVLRDREVAREMEQAGGDPVVLVLADCVIAPAVDGIDDGRGADEVERDAADYLEQRVEALQGHADDEDLVDAFFLHVGHLATSRWKCRISSVSTGPAADRIDGSTPKSLRHCEDW